MKYLGLFCLVLAKLGVESKAAKEPSMSFISTSSRTWDFMTSLSTLLSRLRIYRLNVQYDGKDLVMSNPHRCAIIRLFLR